MKQATPARDGSLDAFRGLDVLLMILVNLQGADEAAFPWLVHAPWHGLTFADLVFPIFLFITGLSIPLAIDRIGFKVSWTAIFKRVFLLFMIGVVLGWLIKPSFDPAMIRWAGVLQRIAIVYLICAAVAIASRGMIWPLLLAGFFLLLHSALLLMVAAPGEAMPSLEAGRGISAWFDQHLLPGRVHRQSWDPEGILSTVPAIASGLIGVGISRWIAIRNVGLAGLLLAAILLIGAGFILTPWLPFNKSLWTASFTLVTAGIGLAVWAALKGLWRFSKSAWLETIGRAALTIYVVHMLLIAIIVRKFPSGKSIWATTFDAVLATGLAPPLAALAFALFGLLITIAILPFLQRRGWLLRV
jgi:predicted acyltransferase